MKYNLHDVMSKAWEIYHTNKQPDGLRPVEGSRCRALSAQA